MAAHRKGFSLLWIFSSRTYLLRVNPTLKTPPTSSRHLMIWVPFQTAPYWPPWTFLVSTPISLMVRELDPWGKSWKLSDLMVRNQPTLPYYASWEPRLLPTMLLTTCIAGRKNSSMASLEAYTFGKGILTIFS